MISETKPVEVKDWRPPLVALIGVGMGREDLSRRALGWIERAQVLAGGERHLEFFPDHTGETILIKSPIADALGRIEEASKDLRTAVLASGDPFFYGIGQRLVERLGAGRVHAIANVTAVQALFARLGEAWDGVKTFSLHGRTLEHDSAWLRELRGGAELALFTDGVHTPAWIARRMTEAGVTDRLLAVAENLGTPEERIVRATLQEARSMTFAPLNIVAVLPDRPGEPESEPRRIDPVLGIEDEAFDHEAGMITKREVRAVALAYLQPSAGLVLWDVGAASGSVSIEAARMAPLKAGYAVEKNPARFAQLEKNIRRFRCFEIRPVCGQAPEALESLPDPDRVFIGGGGAGIESILEAVAGRLRPGGRLVVTAVSLSTLEAVRAYCQSRSLEFAVSQVQVSRSVPIGSSLRLEPINPVFIISARRKA